MRTQPAWINKQLFPFESKWIDIDGQMIHYVDENPSASPTLLFVHGTPEWSFGFRDLMRLLKTSFRCVAVDHLGFGLSDKPAGGDYRIESHSGRLTRFVQKLGLKNITIVANDFGGSIAMGYALQEPGNIRSVVLFNTWMWSLRADAHFTRPTAILNSWVGRFLYLRLNAPVTMVMPSAFGDRKKLTREIHRHYKMPVPTAASRVALYKCALELMDASEWWESLWNKLDLLQDKPFLMIWGMKDSFVPAHVLDKWRRRLPAARVVCYDDAGHFVQEERADDMAREILKLLA